MFRLAGKTERRDRKRSSGGDWTHIDNGRVAGNCGGLVLLDSAGALLNSKILDIGTTEDDVLVDLI